MSASTNDCKEFLLKNYPETKKAFWKRVTKYKNTDGFFVRVFQYLNDVMVGVLDVNGELSLIRENEELERQNKADINYVVSKNQKESSPFTGGYGYGRIPQSSDDKTKKSNSGAANYIFSIYRSNEGMFLGGTMIYVTKYSYWKKHGYMYDQPDYKPREYMPNNWEIDDINECGSWLLENDISHEEIHKIMVERGFMYEQEFDDFINKS